jgi:hypothetical protein
MVTFPAGAPGDKIDMSEAAANPPDTPEKEFPMTANTQNLLKRLADRLRTDPTFARSVATDPEKALSRWRLAAAHRAALSALALVVAAGVDPAAVSGAVIARWW